ncbi:hypothetical protein BZM26_09670 [Paraburkholderia strydomiana]|nr:hypothetical protein BZM26_09670 [Paraburkholderia strydomiana]
MENFLLMLVVAGSSSLCACTAQPQTHAGTTRPVIVVHAPRGEPGDFRVCPDGRVITYPLSHPKTCS